MAARSQASVKRKRPVSTSFNLDMEDVDPLLRTLALKGSLLGEIERDVRGLAVDETTGWKFEVVWDDGRAEDVLLLVFMDDIDAPDVEVRGSRGVIDIVNQWYHAYVRKKEARSARRLRRTGKSKGQK